MPISSHCSVDKGKSQWRVDVVFLYLSYEHSTKELPFLLICPHSISFEPQIRSVGLVKQCTFPWWQVQQSRILSTLLVLSNISLTHGWITFKFGLSIIAALESATDKSAFNYSAGFEGVHNHDKKNHTPAHSTRAYHLC